MTSLQIGLSEVVGVTGGVVVVDVLRAFTTAAYAFDAGADAIYLMSNVAEALRFKERNPGVLAMGEEGGSRLEGFDFSNSPASLVGLDLAGRTLVQRTTAGTQGVVGASPTASRLWASSLVCASATAAALIEAGVDSPKYVITGFDHDAPDTTGKDDRLTAALIERARTGQSLNVDETISKLRETFEARKILDMSADDGSPADIELASEVDRFNFAMEAVKDEWGIRLEAVPYVDPPGSIAGALRPVAVNRRS